MTERMQPFIANSIRLILQKLHTAQLRNFDSPTARNDRLRDETTEFVLDASAAEILHGSSLIFPDPGSFSNSDWYVLHLASVDKERGIRIFKFAGRLSAALSNTDFVRRAYQNVLIRDIDEVGQSIYPPLLEGHQLSRRDVLKILAESDEADARAVSLIIIPYPSSWLSSLSLDPDADFASASVVVKVAGP